MELLTVIELNLREIFDLKNKHLLIGNKSSFVLTNEDQVLCVKPIIYKIIFHNK